MGLLLIVAQVALAVVLTPLAVERGLRTLISLATQGNFNLQYQLQFAVSHYGTYVTALVVALIFWLVGRILASLLGRHRIPTLLTLLATIVLALGFAHLSTLPMVSALDTEFYARTFMTLPPITYPLVGCILAALLLPGRRVK